MKFKRLHSLVIRASFINSLHRKPRQPQNFRQLAMEQKRSTGIISVKLYQTIYSKFDAFITRNGFVPTA